MTQRERLRREVRALTGESRMSAVILGVLPLALALVIGVINPGYLARLFDEPAGNAMLVGGAALAAIGFWWMSRIVRIEV
jgi:tight adherence protein B